MAKEEKNITIPKNYLFWIFLIFLIILSYLIVNSYLVALISSFILAYLVRPVYSKLEKKLGKSISALLSILLVLIILIVPSFFVIRQVIVQTSKFISEGSFKEFIGPILENPVVERLNLNFESIIGSDSPLIPYLTSTLSSIPSIIIGLFIMLFSLYFILVNWDHLSKTLTKYVPLKNKEKTIKEISNISNFLVYSTFLIALIEFFIAAGGFYLIGNRFYLLIAALIFFFAFIPGLGPIIVWVPIAIYYFFIGDVIRGIGTIVLGLILSIGIESIAKIKFQGSRTKINPVIMLIGIFGGVSVFGVFGFIIGPLILAYTLKILEDVIEG